MPAASTCGRAIGTPKPCPARQRGGTLGVVPLPPLRERLSKEVPMLAPRPRRLVAGACAVASCAVLVDDCRATEEPAPATTGYAAIANRLQAHLGALWNEREQRYDSGPGAAVAEVNADLLLLHAIAAQRGPARPSAAQRGLAGQPARVTAAPPARGGPTRDRLTGV